MLICKKTSIPFMYIFLSIQCVVSLICYFGRNTSAKRTLRPTAREGGFNAPSLPLLPVCAWMDCSFRSTEGKGKGPPSFRPPARTIEYSAVNVVGKQNYKHNFAISNLQSLVYFAFVIYLWQRGFFASL